jgi:hypothetical protein
MPPRGSDRPARRGRPAWAYLVLVGLGSLGTAATIGGWSLVSDPTGGAIGLPHAWIRDTAFGDYLLPGLLLLVVFGAGSFVVLYGALRRRAWAWPGGVALGVGTVVWIVVQVAVVRRLHPLQLLILAMGVGFVVVLALPSMRDYYDASATLSRLRR